MCIVLPESSFHFFPHYVCGPRFMYLLSQRFLVQSFQWKPQNNAGNLLKVNSEDTRMISMASFSCFSCYLWTDFKQRSDVSIVDFAHVNATLERIWPGIRTFIKTHPGFWTIFMGWVEQPSSHSMKLTEHFLFWSKYSRMDQVKCLEESLKGYNKGLLLLTSYVVLDYEFELVILCVLNLHVLVQ